MFKKALGTQASIACADSRDNKGSRYVQDNDSKYTKEQNK